MKRDLLGWHKGRALEWFGGDEGLLREMCQIFLEESPKLLKRLREGLETGDPEEVMVAAHTLAGELIYLEAAPALHAAKLLEGMGSQKDLVQAAQILALLEEEVANLHLCLKNLTGKPQ